ncbi:hypothetical protein HELRODRAFT_64765 [Helobdella robusta]|uniref:Uncharacterized protein n=1 Tax=Helobdella robusta TaxID=6412 RepID=T1FXY7_HELRO|nr:hypothetical protein HELRODRAFT_64765 [Helobdella robusta]ESO06159.1 hypothetical protein HELRODRAFT_64765 [Helobdella robusta]
MYAYGNGMESKEELQNRHYCYLNHLQEMAKDLPRKYQQRLPYNVLSDLAKVLLDSQLFEIVAGLKEVQQLEERNLSNQRLNLTKEQKTSKESLKKKHRDLLQDNVHKPHELPYIQARCQKEMQEFEENCAKELKKMDTYIIKTLDQKIIDQQSMLEKAGIPGFVVTVVPIEIQLQMYLLEFIFRLKQVECPA